MTIPRLTVEQSAILTAYTDCLMGPFSAFHEYAERKLGRPILTHEFADRAIWDRLKEASKEDFLSICAQSSQP